jgi:arylsulfatase
MFRRVSFAVTFVASMLALSVHTAAAQTKPNIVVIFGDDVGINNISAYAHGVVGYRTPNIDRIAREGALFTDYYGQQSCTAGRAAFLTGQAPIRTGLTKVGLPGAPQGLMKSDPTLAELLKPLGYATGQFGKNHLGDRDEFLPTVHGFDEFFGNLYHLNAEEEPENEDYPKNPEFRKKFGPRGVLHSWANGDGTQKIEDTGPLTKKRMETVDDEFLAAAIAFMDKAKDANKPFFTWVNTTRMHNFTHVRAEHRTSGLGEYADGMIEHDGEVGRVLDYLDKSGLAQNTVVVYTSDNGPMVDMWPDAASTPFRSEKATNWEGAWRVPAVVRWPNLVKPGTIINDIVAGEDWLPTIVAAVGAPGVKEKLLAGYQVGAQSYKVHLDGYDQTALLAGTGPGARKEFFYFSDDGDLLAIRYEHLKMHFMIQNATGIDVWRKPFETLRGPLVFDLRSDPGERGQEGIGYNNWWYRHAFYAVPAQNVVGQFIASFKDFAPRQKPGSFTVNDALKTLENASGASK